MRNTEERLTAVLNRVTELDRQSRRTRAGYLAVMSFAACLLAIVALSAYMPKWTESSANAESSGMAYSASLFAGNGALGYLVIGILAFILGVSVTILCFRLRSAARDKDDTT